MVARLNKTVLAGGRVFPAGTVWSQELSTVPEKFWDGPTGAPAERQPDPEQPQEPPRSGRGSGVDAWRQYATEVGVEIPDGASRDEIVAAVDAR